MSFTIRIRGVADRPIAAEYSCPEHGRFTVTVARDANGYAPATHRCETCAAVAPYVISAPAARVRKFEVTRGGWQKPERKTFLDTRELGEGQDIEEFRDKRAAIRDEQRRQSLKELMDG